MLAGMARRASPQAPKDRADTALDTQTRERLRELANWLAGRPWNRSGTDKSWVLAAMSESLAFEAQVRQAKLVRE
jgi:hypothetical protein